MFFRMFIFFFIFTQIHQYISIKDFKSLKGVGSWRTITGPVNQTPAVNHFSAYFKYLLSELVFISGFHPQILWCKQVKNK